MNPASRRTFLAGAFATAALGAASTSRAAEADRRLSMLLDELSAVLTGPGEASPWKLSDESAAAADQRFRAPTLALAKLQAFKPTGLTPRGELDLETVRSGLEREAALAAAFPFGAAPGRPFIVTPRAGNHLAAAAGLSGPPPTAATRDAYLDALQRLAGNLDGETERTLSAAAGWNVILPKSYLLDVQAKASALAAQRAEQSALVLAAPSDLRDHIEVAFEAAVRPALARQAQALAKLLSRAPEAGGAVGWRRGGDFHALTLKAGLGLDLTPDEVDRAARAEATRLSADLSALLQQEGLSEGGVGVRLRALMADPAGLYPDSDAGRDRAVADMNGVLQGVRSRLPSLHPHPPPGPFAVRRMAAADEARARPGYRTATSTGGTYVVDLHAIRARPAWTLPTVVCHETLPGHLLQLPLQTAAKPHPLRVRYATGYFEGWGVYAESLGDGLGLYDRRARIGYLQSMLFRLSRAIADIGVHHRGWTPERTRAELAEFYGGALFNSLDVEVERVFLSPGAGGADAFGRLEMLRLRREWRGDLPSFHAAVLDRGPYPLRLLGQAAALSANARGASA